MSFEIILVPGETFPDGSAIDRAALRRAAKPTAKLDGAISGTEVPVNSMPVDRLIVGPMFYAADAGTGGVNVYVVTLSPAPAGLSAGLRMAFRALSANTGAVTLNVNGLGAKDVRKNFSGALAAGDIQVGQMVELAYDAANGWWQMLSQVGNPPAAGFTMPPGSVVAYGGASAPSGWLLCDGTAVSRATYADLFTAIGLGYNVDFTADVTTDQLTCSSAHGFTTEDPVTVYNVGGALPAGLSGATTYYARAVSATVVTLHDTAAHATANTNRIDITGTGTGKHTIGPATTFKLPDTRGRTPVGHGAGTGLTQRYVGQTFGTETHVLTAAQLPPHVHKVSGGTGSALANTVAGNPNVTKGYPLEYDTLGNPYNVSADGALDGAGSAQLQSSPHANTQPSLVANFIIKT